MDNDQLSAEWRVERLGAVCEVIAGQSPQGKFYNDTGTGTPFYQGKKEFGDKFIRAPKKWTSHTTKMAYLNDILMSVRAPVGPINFTTQSLCIGRGLAAIRAGEVIDKDFLFYQLLSKQNEIKGNEGAVFASINKAQIENLEISLPSLPEQKRIVAILDEAFAGIRLAVANAEKNLANARELFESYLNNVFTQKGDGWKITELGNIIDVLTDYHANGSYKILKQHVELKETEDFAWMVRSTDFENNFKNRKRYISESAYNYLKKSKLFGGEIIMSKIGNAGKVYFMPYTDRPCSLAMNLFLIRLDDEKVSNEYVYRYLNSKSGKAQIAPMLNGAATQTITKDSVRSILVPLPAKNIQIQILRELELLEDETSLLESIYQQKLTALNKLKQSILQKAFAGELTQREENA